MVTRAARWWSWGGSPRSSWLWRRPSRRGHALTLDRRRTLRGVCKSWPQGGARSGGQSGGLKRGQTSRFAITLSRVSKGLRTGGWIFKPSRWGHVLTIKIRRNLRSVCKSWPQGAASRRSQAELCKKDPVLMCRPLPPQERSRHGEVLKPPRLIPLGAATNPNGSATDHAGFLFCC